MLVELPAELQEALERQFQSLSSQQLSRAASSLSTAYRSGQRAGAPVARSAQEALAYAAFRLPATYAADVAALAAVREQRPDWRPRTLLDLGAGLGSGMWAATTIWPSIERICAVDAQPQMIAVGRELARESSRAGLRSAEWIQSDLRTARLAGRDDLVLISYVLGELDPPEISTLAERAWAVTDGILVVVEPGTPAGDDRVRQVRDLLVASGGHPIAPCPHSPSCRMNAEDWCHFSVRLPRNELHRAAKSVSLGYEDEKFSYVAISRTPAEREYSRIVRHPQIRKGHIYLQLCTPEGPKTVVVSKRDREIFSRARKAEWGDVFEFPDGGSP